MLPSLLGTAPTAACRPHTLWPRGQFRKDTAWLAPIPDSTQQGAGSTAVFYTVTDNALISFPSELDGCIIILGNKAVLMHSLLFFFVIEGRIPNDLPLEMPWLNLKFYQVLALMFRRSEP